MISHDDLLRQLSYDPETGVFKWRIKKCRVEAGDIAGRKSNGYVVIKINQGHYPAHRLAWFYMKQVWPAHQIDHIDRVRNNNRWINLREATNKQNHENLGLNRTNTSGEKGVRWEAARRRWFAFITHNSVMKNLGRYVEKADAVAARRQAERELFTHST